MPEASFLFFVNMQKHMAFCRKSLPGPPGQTRGYAETKNTKNYILCSRETNFLFVFYVGASLSEFFVLSSLSEFFV